MYSGKRDSVMKETLRSLCCSNGWCYGIFWGFDQRNSLFLTCQDTYYEEQMGALIDSMQMQVHVLGRGEIGQAAFTRNHRWMFPDALQERQKCFGSAQSPEILEDNSNLNAQLSMGIKTIGLISVEQWGVLQLGSTYKILESKDFIDQVKLTFWGMDEGQKLELPENEPSSSDSNYLNSGTQLSTLLSCYAMGSSGDNFPHFADTDGFIESNYPISPLSQVFSSSLDFTGSTMIESQVHTGNKSSSQLDQLPFEPASSFDFSVLTSSQSHLPSRISNYECSTSSSLNALAATLLQGQRFSSKDTKNDRDCPALFDPTCLNASRPTSLFTLDELFPNNIVAEDLCKACPMDSEFSQLSSPLSCPINTSFSTILSNDQSHTTAHMPVPKLSAENYPTNSMQSSVTDAIWSNNSDNKLYDMSSIDRLLNGLGADPGCDQKALLPVANGAGLDFNMNVSGCMAAFGSKVRTSNSLFSRLGLDHLLDGRASSLCSVAKPRFEDPSLSAAKRRKVDAYSWIQDPNAGNTIEHNSETSAKETRGLSVSDGPIMGAGSSSSSKRQRETAKTGKKSKPGTRPRPKDRQMIQDRLAELKGLIPNGEKMSIDRLLERTIRHLNFMSSLAKHSESLIQIDETKSRTTVQQGHSNSDGGVTWACEVGDKSMICPLIVEDLGIPGQMLIEILYEEHGFFLEIIDIIRGFGLTILKGVMEVRETKIWARFIVEAKGNRHGTRHEVFSSLIQLLQMTGGNPAKATEHFGNNISSGMPLFNNYQSAPSFPATLADAI